MRRGPKRRGAAKRAPDATIPTTADLLESDFASRKVEREIEVCDLAQKVVARCGYNRAATYLWEVSPAARHAVLGMRRRDASLLQVWLASPMKWLDEVYKRGLAAASGSFVFQVVEEQPGGSLIVIAGKQCRGCSVNLSLERLLFGEVRATLAQPASELPM